MKNTETAMTKASPTKRQKLRVIIILLLAAFALLFASFRSFAQDTVSQEYLGYHCQGSGKMEPESNYVTLDLGTYRFPNTTYGRKDAMDACEAANGFTFGMYIGVYGGYRRYGTGGGQQIFPAGSRWFQISDSAVFGCPSTHPIDNGDGTCSKTEEQKECEANQGQIVFGKFHVSSTGQVCFGGCTYQQKAGVWIQLAGDDWNEYGMDVENTGNACSLPDGTGVNPDGSEAPESQPDGNTTDSCMEEATKACSAQGLYASGVGLVNGQCSHSCVEEKPEATPPDFNMTDPYGDHDGDGVLNVNDPDHPNNDGSGTGEGWGESDPDGDHDGDGVPNQDDPEHPLNDGSGSGGWYGGGSSSGELGDLTAVENLLERLLMTSVENNADNEDLKEIQNRLALITKEGQQQDREHTSDIVGAIDALGEKVENSGGGGGVGGTVEIVGAINNLKDELTTAPEDTGLFYTPKYPDGIEPVWNQFKADFNNTELAQWIDSFVVNGGSYDFSWQFCFPMGFGCHNLAIPNWVIAFVRAMLLVSAVLFARRMVTGG